MIIYCVHFEMNSHGLSLNAVLGGCVDQLATHFFLYKTYLLIILVIKLLNLFIKLKFLLCISYRIKMKLGEWTNLCSMYFICSMILLYYLVLQKKDSNALLDSEDDLCDFIIILVSS